MQRNGDEIMKFVQGNTVCLGEGIHEFQKKIAQRRFVPIFEKMQKSLHGIGINTGSPAMVEMKGDMLANFADERLRRI